jgi:hypothetical protein
MHRGYTLTTQSRRDTLVLFVKRDEFHRTQPLIVLLLPIGCSRVITLQSTKKATAAPADESNKLGGQGDLIPVPLPAPNH